GDRSRRLRCRQRRAAARREQRSRQSVRGRQGSRRPALHLLQQVPVARRRAPDRVLRAQPLRELRRHDSRGHVGLPPAGVRMITRLARLIVYGFAAAGVVTVVLLLWVLVSVGTDRPETYDDITMHFKYGSIGSEPGGSLLDPIGGVLPPYWVLKSLPSI